MKLNIYKNQKEIEKTYTIDDYDIMYGTVEDILSVFDDNWDSLESLFSQYFNDINFSIGR